MYTCNLLELCQHTHPDCRSFPPTAATFLKNQPTPRCIQSCRSGEIVEVNTAAIEAPGDVLHKDAGTDAWLIELDLFLDESEEDAAVDDAEAQWAGLLQQ